MEGDGGSHWRYFMSFEDNLVYYFLPQNLFSYCYLGAINEISMGEAVYAIFALIA